MFAGTHWDSVSYTATIKKDNTNNLTGSHDKSVSEREREREREREGGREGGGREGGDREGEEENAKRLRVRA